MSVAFSTFNLNKLKTLLRGKCTGNAQFVLGILVKTPRGSLETNVYSLLVQYRDVVIVFCA